MTVRNNIVYITSHWKGPCHPAHPGPVQADSPQVSLPPVLLAPNQKISCVCFCLYEYPPGVNQLKPVFLGEVGRRPSCPVSVGRSKLRSRPVMSKREKGVLNKNVVEG